jgi:hypothetical protein
MSFIYPNLTLGKPKIDTFLLFKFLNNMPYFALDEVFDKKGCKNYTIHNFTDR